MSTPSIGPIRRFGRYTLVKKLATGGMAEIWLARQSGLAGFNRFVVIKKILNHLSEQETFVKMFLDEARTSAQLNHPNVVQIYDLGREGESYYIAMEFIAGENLAAIAWRGMKRGRPLSPSFAARIIADTCKALHYAHHLRGSDGRALEIVHRDISPQNILVTYEGEIKVVDFGIAKAATKSEHTKTGMLKGKFSYMSPEQCLGTPVDMRSDVFALGILLYELCTGKRLFKHESELMILEMITKRSVVPPSQVAPGISARLEEVIMTALEKPVEARFQTAQDMQIALEEFLREEDRPVTNAEIAAYMRSLFEDKIEEKRLLREAASRDDFESVLSDDEATEQSVPTRPGASKRRVVHGLPPSQVSSQQASKPPSAPRGAPTHPSTTPPFVAAQAIPLGRTPVGVLVPGQTPSGYVPGSYPLGTPGATYPGPGASYPSALTGLPPDTSNWIARLVIVGALVVILVASAILYQQLMREPAQSLPAHTIIPTVPTKTGKLQLDSIPSGAAIFLDGKPMTLDSGEQARTPSDLTSLQYGTTYTILLMKEGHKPHEQPVYMGPLTDGQAIKPQLEALPGKIIAEVTGPRAAETRISFSGVDVGAGPKVTREMEAHQNVVVAATLPGMTCNAEPARLRIAPDATVRSTIRCEPQRAVSEERASRPGAAGTKNEPARPRRDREDDRAPAATKSERAERDDPARSAGTAGGCKANPSLPPGYVTISTTPYSDIYIAGRKVGQTPLSRHKLPAGCAEIRAVTDDGRSMTARITIEPNRVSIYKFDVK